MRMKTTLFLLHSALVGYFAAACASPGTGRVETEGGHAGASSSGGEAVSTGGRSNAGGGAGEQAGGAPASSGANGASAGAAGQSALALRFVVLASGSKAKFETSFPGWADCDSAPGEDPTTSSCLPANIRARLNGAFTRLLDVGALFARGSFEIIENSPYAQLETDADEDGDLDAVASGQNGQPLPAQDLTVPNSLTVIVVEDIDGIGGFAGENQGLNAANGAYLVVRLRNFEVQVAEHEFGHVIGLKHFVVDGQQYPYCGGASFASKRDDSCVCENNVMGAVLRVPDASCSCPESEVAHPRLDTPGATPFVSQVAKCWWEQQRLIEVCSEEASEGTIYCRGPSGSVQCTCPNAGGVTTTIDSCTDSAAGARRASLSTGCPVDCDVTWRRSRYHCSGDPFQITCQCGAGGPSFTAPGCSEAYSADRDAAVARTCEIKRCTSTKVAGLSCEGIANLSTIGCICPNGNQFDTPSDCSTLDSFADLICSD
jgi:hypothetical protein